jgi:hypothetical protein
MVRASAPMRTIINEMVTMTSSEISATISELLIRYFHQI